MSDLETIRSSVAFLDAEFVKNYKRIVTAKSAAELIQIVSKAKQIARRLELELVEFKRAKLT